MTTTDITSKFTRQQDGAWSASVSGFKGTIKIVHSNPAYDWASVYSLTGATKKFIKTSTGPVSVTDVDVPYTSFVYIVTERKPSAAYIITEAESYVDSVVQQLKPGSGSAPDSETVLDLQRQIDEQKALNEAQQAELERNAAHDTAQQEQIDANTALNEAQERGLGEEATNDLINKVFGKS